MKTIKKTSLKNGISNIFMLLTIIFSPLLLANETTNETPSDQNQSAQPMVMKQNEASIVKKVPPSQPIKMANKATGTRDPHANSGGYEYRGMAGWEETDEMTVSKIIIDQLEYRDGNNTSLNRWDIQGWRGSDYKKLWIKFEGEDDNSTSEGEFEVQALYSKAFSAFWDAQFGARYDRAYGRGVSDDRYFGVMGIQGLAPYWFEVEAATFIDKDANFSARIVVSYDLLLTQRLIFQPRFEVNASANDIAELGIGQGINDVQFDLRLRYEIKREIAPYIGITWQKQYGDTAAYNQLEGNSSEFTELVLGVRIWF